MRYRYDVSYYGIVGDGVTDVTSKIQDLVDRMEDGTTIFFPPGKYVLSSTINAGGKSIAVEGAYPGGWEGYGSVLYGNFAGPLWKNEYPAKNPSFTKLGFFNAHPNGGGLSFGGVGGRVEHCRFLAYRALIGAQNTFTWLISSCAFAWNGNTPGSIGIYCAGHSQINGVDVVGFDNGIRLAGMCVLQSARIEVNRVGLMLGLDLNGSRYSWGGSVTGISFEANDNGISIESAMSGHISGCSIYSSVGSPSHGGLSGLKVVMCSTTVRISDLLANGDYKEFAIGLTRDAHGILDGCHAQNDSGQIWSIPAGCPMKITNCNNPGVS